MASVRTESGTLVAQGATPDAAEQQAKRLNRRAELQGLKVRYVVDDAKLPTPEDE